MRPRYLMSMAMAMAMSGRLSVDQVMAASQAIFELARGMGDDGEFDATFSAWLSGTEALRERGQMLDMPKPTMGMKRVPEESTPRELAGILLSQLDEGDTKLLEAMHFVVMLTPYYGHDEFESVATMAMSMVVREGRKMGAQSPERTGDMDIRAFTDELASRFESKERILKTLIGAQIASMREKYGMTQGDVCASAGIPQSTMSNLEKGMFSMVNLMRVCAAMEKLTKMPMSLRSLMEAVQSKDLDLPPMYFEVIETIERVGRELADK